MSEGEEEPLVQMSTLVSPFGRPSP